VSKAGTLLTVQVSFESQVPRWSTESMKETVPVLFAASVFCCCEMCFRPSLTGSHDP